MRTDTPIMATDTFINGNGDWFFKFRPDDKPHLERLDTIISPDPLPDEEEYWGKE